MDENGDSMELLACTPPPVDPRGFNPDVVLPYGCTVEYIQRSMDEFIDFLGFINQQLYTKGIQRFESMLMPANFSSMVGEFMISTIPKHCPTIAKNLYHDGYPDLIPNDLFPNASTQHADEGIEVIGSRYPGGWQGHSPENAWLMVFVFDSNRPVSTSKGIGPKSFRFIKVVGARLGKEDWKLSGRKQSTTSVMPSGYEKMMANWIYIAPGYEDQVNEGTGESPENV